MPARGKEQHRIERVGWLRAAVLGANDGILSTASLVLGVATAHASHSNVLVAGVAGLMSGAMSMAGALRSRSGAHWPWRLQPAWEHCSVPWRKSRVIHVGHRRPRWLRARP